MGAWGPLGFLLNLGLSLSRSNRRGARREPDTVLVVGGGLAQIGQRQRIDNREILRGSVYRGPQVGDGAGVILVLQTGDANRRVKNHAHLVGHLLEIFRRSAIGLDELGEIVEPLLAVFLGIDEQLFGVGVSVL